MEIGDTEERVRISGSEIMLLLQCRCDLFDFCCISLKKYVFYGCYSALCVCFYALELTFKF